MTDMGTEAGTTNNVAAVESLNVTVKAFVRLMLKIMHSPVVGGPVSLRVMTLAPVADAIVKKLP